MKYAWIRRNAKQWPVTVQCTVLGVSASGYFEARARNAMGQAASAGGRCLSDAALLAHIRAAHAGSKGEYGWPRMWRELLANAIQVGKEQVRLLMSLHGIKARGKRRYVVTTDSRHDPPVAPNQLARDSAPATPDTVWAGDIIYVATGEGWPYLAAVLDPHSRQVVVWSMQARMKTGLVSDALRMAWFRRRPQAGLIFQSDRGSRYCSAQFQAMLAGDGMLSSMSRKGNCWGNAPTESLWGSLKLGRLH